MNINTMATSYRTPPRPKRRESCNPSSSGEASSPPVLQWTPRRKHVQTPGKSVYRTQSSLVRQPLYKIERRTRGDAFNRSEPVGRMHPEYSTSSGRAIKCIQWTEHIPFKELNSEWERTGNREILHKSIQELQTLISACKGDFENRLKMRGADFNQHVRVFLSKRATEETFAEFDQNFSHNVFGDMSNAKQLRENVNKLVELFYRDGDPENPLGKIQQTQVEELIQDKIRLGEQARKWTRNAKRRLNHIKPTDRQIMF